ncbi:MAG TPA: helix-turn-helix transcriptional regulator [Thermomicrobiales bacterium]|nr:helix-turn-helix transcriptional regulator [Thermomicrobiales bacterium]
MQTRRDHTLPPREDPSEHGIDLWLADVERELQQARDQAQASLHYCHLALLAVAGARARIASGQSAAHPDALPRLPRLLAGGAQDACGPERGRPGKPTDLAVAGITVHRLTQRESEILAQIVAGRSNKEIALRLYLSIRTVERHIANIYLKIDVHTKAEATAYALRNDLA